METILKATLGSMYGLSVRLNEESKSANRRRCDAPILSSEHWSRQAPFLNFFGAITNEDHNRWPKMQAIYAISRDYAVGYIFYRIYSAMTSLITLIHTIVQAIHVDHAHNP